MGDRSPGCTTPGFAEASWLKAGGCGLTRARKMVVDFELGWSAVAQRLSINLTWLNEATYSSVASSTAG